MNFGFPAGGLLSRDGPAGILRFQYDIIFQMLNSLRLLCCILLAGSAGSSLFGGSRAERWVEREIALGHEADLSNQPDRVLSPAFLEKLLTRVRSGRHGVHVKGGIVNQKLDLRGIEVSQPVWLQQFRFLEPVDFSLATFHKVLSLSGSHFMKPLAFDRANMDESLFLQGARFYQDASFNLASIGRLAKFERSIFAGVVDMIGATVGAELNCSGTHFEAVRNYETQEHPETVTFNSMRVGSAAFFDDAEFADGADFRFMRAYAFIAHRMRFLNPTSTAHFSKMDVNATFLLSNSIFTHEIIMSGLSVNSLILDTLKSDSIDIGHAQVHNDLRIGKVEVKELTAPSLHVSGPAILSKVSIAEKANLQACHFDSLELTDVSWPRGKDAFQCDGMVFRHIECKRNKEDQLDELPKMAKYSASTYAGVAGFLKNQGLSDRANKITMDQRDRESESMRWFERVANFAYWALVGYGVRPWRAFVWMAAIVVFGTWLFTHRDEMSPTDATKPGPPYNPFWYSLGLFLPVVDLDMSKQWRPVKTSWKAHYARLHVLLGWILVPLGVAAITGLLK